MIARAGLKKRVGEVLLYVAARGRCGRSCSSRWPRESSCSAIMAGALAPVLSRCSSCERMARRRSALFAEQLPDALDLVRAALQAGHGLMAAMSVVAEEFPDPIAAGVPGRHRGGPPRTSLARGARQPGRACRQPGPRAARGGNPHRAGHRRQSRRGARQDQPHDPRALQDRAGDEGAHRTGTAVGRRAHRAAVPGGAAR